MLNNMKLKAKLIGGFCVVAFIAMLIGMAGVWAVRDIGSRLTHIGTQSLPAVENADQIMEELTHIEMSLRTIMNPNVDDETYQQALKDLQGAREDYLSAQDAYEALAKDEEEKAAWNKYLSAVKEWRELNTKIAETVSGIRQSGMRNPFLLMRDLLGFRGDHYALMFKAIQFIENKEAFEGGGDPTACNFGKWLKTFRTENKEINSLISAIHQHHSVFHNSVPAIRAAVARGDLDAARHTFHREMEPAADSTLTIFNQMIDVAQRAVATYDELDHLVFVTAKDIRTKTFDSLEEIIKLTKREAEHALSEGKASLSFGQNFTFAGMIVGTLLALVLGAVLALSITRPVLKLANASRTLAAQNEEMARVAGAIADGDLTVEAKSAQENLDLGFSARGDEIGMLAGAFSEMMRYQSELGQAMSRMTGNLNDILARVNEASGQVASGASQVSDASQSLSQGATEQAASLEEITASMTEVGSQTKTNAENAVQANKLAASARTAADNGTGQVEQMMSAMCDIQSSSKEIVKIVKVIDDIAFQTNLLALNAAVEAARAGRHGKGFAVVAEEVRNLAARSAKAARETAEGISSSMEKVENGTKVASSTVAALSQIVQEVTKVNDLVNDIAAASNEQAQAISQMSTGMTQIDSVTQQNTANAEETASAAEELSSQSAELRELLSRFRLRSAGAQTRSADHRPAAAKRAAAPGKGNGAGSSWGKAKKLQTPGEIIALDDNDFGRF